MGLYERDYARNNINESTYSMRDESSITSFVKETYKLFAASMLAGSAGAYVGISLAGFISTYFIPLLILEIGLLIGLHFTKNKPGINLLMLFSFVLMSGLMLGPILSYALSIAGGAAIIGNAFAMTAVTFGAMSFFAIKTTKDFTSYGKPLMIALFVIIGFGILNLFLGNSILNVMISGAAVLLFSVLVIYDTQNIINGNYETPIDGAIGLYLDFLNIFTGILNLLLSFNNDD